MSSIIKVKIERTLEGDSHGSNVCSVLFRPKVRLILTACFDNHLRIWNSETFQYLTKKKLGTTRHQCLCPWSDDSVLLSSYSGNGRESVFHVQLEGSNPYCRLNKVISNNSTNTSHQIQKVGEDRFVFCSWSGHVRLFSLSHGGLIRQWPITMNNDQSTYFSRLESSSLFDKCFYVNSNGRKRVRRIHYEKTSPDFDFILPHTVRSIKIILSSNKEEILVCGGSGLSFYNCGTASNPLKPPKLIHNIDTTTISREICSMLVINNRYVVTGDSGGYVSAFDTKKSYEQVIKSETVHQSAIFQLSPFKTESGTTRILSCSQDRNVHVLSITGMVQKVDVKDKEELKERSVRINTIVEMFRDFKLPLRNLELALPKTFLVHSRIRNLEKITEYKGCTDLNLSVEENTVLRVILESPVDIRTDNLVDYYMLFRRLGMKREMRNILDRLNKQLITGGFEVCYQCFKDLCKNQFESETLQSWFRLEDRVPVSTFESSTFDTAFGLSLFNQMKDKSSELQKNPKLYLLDGGLYIGFLQGQFMTYNDILDPLNHSDFSGVNNMEELSLKSMFLELFNSPPFTNIRLISSDGECFPCHKEVLVYGLSHFERMIKFPGVEGTGVKSPDAVIEIEDMDSSVLSSVLEFVYTGSLDKTDQMETLIKLAVQADKMLSKYMLRAVVKKMDQIVVSSGERVDLQKLRTVMQRTGFLLHENEVVSELVLFFLLDWCEEEQLEMENIRKMIAKSYDHVVVQSQLREIVEVRKENEEMKRLIQIQAKQIESLEKRMKKVEEFMMKKQNDGGLK